MLISVQHNFAHRRAMTVAELIIGMGMTTMVLGALSAVWYAVGHTWGANNSPQSAALTGSQTVARLEKVFRAAKYVFQCNQTTAVIAATDTQAARSVSSGAVLFWRGDDWNGSADGAVQIGEVALIEHDPQAARIYLYQTKPYALLDSGQRSRAGGVATWAELSNPATRTLFKSYDFVQQSVIGEAVTAVRFNVPTSTWQARPIVEYALTVSRPKSELPMYGSTALRGPTTRPR